MTQPIVCPHCGGRIVNGVDVDQQLYPVILDDVGGWREGSWDEGVSPRYRATALHCQTCQSTFIPPPEAKGIFDESLNSDEVIEVLHLELKLRPDAPETRKIGRDVIWLGVEDQLIPRLIEVLDTPETSVLRDRLSAIAEELTR